MFWVRPGLTRVAVRLGPWVLKVPRSHVGIVCNLAEASISDANPDHPRLVPTLWTLGGWLNAQAYAGDTLDAVADEHIRAADDLGIRDCVAANIAADYRGSWAIVDYAFSPRALLSWYALPAGSEDVAP